MENRVIEETQPDTGTGRQASFSNNGSASASLTELVAALQAETLAETHAVGPRIIWESHPPSFALFSETLLNGSLQEESEWSHSDLRSQG